MDAFTQHLFELVARGKDSPSDLSSLRKEACEKTNACLALDGVFQNELTLDMQTRWISGQTSTDERIASINARFKKQE
jgi:hypothetical protein